LKNSFCSNFWFHKSPMSDKYSRTLPAGTPKNPQPIN